MYKGKNRTCWNTADDPFQVEGGMSSAVAQGTVAQGDGCSGGRLLRGTVARQLRTCVLAANTVRILH